MSTGSGTLKTRFSRRVYGVGRAAGVREKKGGWLKPVGEPAKGLLPVGSRTAFVGSHPPGFLAQGAVLVVVGGSGL